MLCNSTVIHLQNRRNAVCKHILLFVKIRRIHEQSGSWMSLPWCVWAIWNIFLVKSQGILCNNIGQVFPINTTVISHCPSLLRLITTSRVGPVCWYTWNIPHIYLVKYLCLNSVFKINVYSSSLLSTIRSSGTRYRFQVYVWNISNVCL